jgi:acetolactate synthase regulatory subunit
VQARAPQCQLGEDIRVVRRRSIRLQAVTGVGVARQDAGKTLEIRFVFDSDGGVNDKGVAISKLIVQ